MQRLIVEKWQWLFVVLVAFPVLISCSSQSSSVSSFLTVPQIVALSKKGIPADEIIETIQHSRTIYRLLPNQIENLKHKGVPERVLHYLQKTYRKVLLQYPYLNDWDNWTLYEGYWYASPSDAGPDLWLEDN